MLYSRVYKLYKGYLCSNNESHSVLHLCAGAVSYTHKLKIKTIIFEILKLLHITSIYVPIYCDRKKRFLQVI